MVGFGVDGEGQVPGSFLVYSALEDNTLPGEVRRFWRCQETVDLPASVVIPEMGSGAEAQRIIGKLRTFQEIYLCLLPR